MINIDFDNINDELVYEAFGVEGNEADALMTAIWNCLSLSVKKRCSSCLSIFAEIKSIARCDYIARNLLPILQSMCRIDVNVPKLQELGDIQQK